MSGELEQLQDYFNSDDELETYIRFNFEWNETSFQRLKTILLEISGDDKQSSLYRHYNESLRRIASIMRNPLFTNMKSEEYKKNAKENIDKVEKLRYSLYL